MKTICQMRPILWIVIVIAIMASLGCDNKNGDSERKNKLKTVAVLKYATHPALDATEKGVLEQLTSIGSHVEVLTFNANGNQELAKQLAESITAKNVDVIVAIATPAARAVARTPSSIPMVYGAVADPEGAGILTTGRATGIRNVGPNIVDRALSFMRKALPKAKKLGTIYNPSEQNSVFVQKLIRELAKKYEFEVISVEVRDKAHVASGAESLVRKVDLIYSANDNTINASVSSVVAMANKYQKPFFIGDLTTLKKGPVAAIGLEYYAMGIDVGKIAIQILEGESVTSIRPQDPPTPEIWVNQDLAAKLGLTFLEEAKALIDSFK